MGLAMPPSVDVNARPARFQFAPVDVQSGWERSSRCCPHMSLSVLECATASPLERALAASVVEQAVNEVVRCGTPSAVWLDALECRVRQACEE